jgi:probable rRNA maturation factor
MSEAGERVEHDVSVICDGWREVDAEALVMRVFDAVHGHESAARWPVSVLFTDNERLRELNRVFRGKDRPTNVLSFPAGDRQVEAHTCLGDIALAFETCRDEAAADDVSLADHAAHLLVHGMLHLIGYDHHTEEAARVMETREAQILATLGIANPYGKLAETNDE